MARSTNIYVVEQTGVTVAAFTVKHEMVTWLHRLTETERRDMTVWRVRDGVFSNVGSVLPHDQPPVEIDLAELLS
jgi:hypothetical protein